MSRGYGIDQLYSKKFKELEFTGDWLDLVGKPEVSGSWFIWAPSGNGKTVFAAQLSKYISQFGRVAFNSLEEGISKSLRRAFQLAEITTDDKILPLDKEPISDLRIRLQKPKSPKFIIIDSLQYTGLTVKTYKQLINEFNKKIFIFISHADGKQPAGSVAKAIRYDANIKIWIEGYRATAQSRYGGDSNYIIWEKGAEKYWANHLN